MICGSSAGRDAARSSPVMRCPNGTEPEVCTTQRRSVAVHLAQNQLMQNADDVDDNVISLMTAHVTSDPCNRCEEVVQSDEGRVLDLSDFNVEESACSSDDVSSEDDDVCVSLLDSRHRSGNKCGDDVTLHDASILCSANEGETMPPSRNVNTERLGFIVTHCC